MYWCTHGCYTVLYLLDLAECTTVSESTPVVNPDGGVGFTEIELSACEGPTDSEICDAEKLVNEIVCHEILIDKGERDPAVEQDGADDTPSNHHELPSKMLPLNPNIHVSNYDTSTTKGKIYLNSFTLQFFKYICLNCHSVGQVTA